MHTDAINKPTDINGGDTVKNTDAGSVPAHTDAGSGPAHTDHAKDTDTVTILGARGSIPVSGPEYIRFGGATVCVLVRLAGQTVLLDAGTGLFGLSPTAYPSTLPILLSHPHADHLLGLPLCAPVMDPSAALDIYAVPRGGYSAREQVTRLISPPLWPVTPEQFPAHITFHDLPDTLYLGPVRVDSIEGIHPGGVRVFRLTARGKRVVFVSDCTLTDEYWPTAVEFARDCDLLLCDGQYSDEEWSTRAGFGHNTWTRAAEFGRECGAVRTRIIHHDPFRTDHALDAAQITLRERFSDCAFGFDGEIIPL